MAHTKDDKTPQATPCHVLVSSASDRVPMKNPMTTKQHATLALKEGRERWVV
jgi:hypothetical protein